MVKSAVGTASVTRNLEFIIYADSDDPQSVEVARELGIKVVSGPRKILSDCYNDCLILADGEIFMFAGDDLIFRTSGWDNMVIREFNKYLDGILFVHGDDGYWGGQLGTHGFVSKHWIKAVGYLTPPYFSCDMTDMWITTVADQLRRRSYLPFLIEHMHPAFGKAELDTTHEERIARGERDNVQRLYKELTPQRQQDVEKLRRFMH
jgi:hypothetical protein